LIWSPLWWVYWAVIAVYATTVATTSVGIAMGRRNPRLFAWLLPVFPTIHAGSGWGVLTELVRSRLT
jgi:hypothetical protein